MNTLIDKNKKFKRFDYICTIGNTLVVMLYYHRISTKARNIVDNICKSLFLTSFLDYINHGFLLVFCNLDLFENNSLSKKFLSWNSFWVYNVIHFIYIFLKIYI